MRSFRICIVLIGLAAAVVYGAPDRKPSLAQIVTYESSGKRLSTVLEDLSKSTKVSIKSGSRNTDWQCRDAPIIVSVQDITLLNLLESIADCSHLAFTKDKPVAPTDAPVYRLWRSRERQQELDSFFSNRRDKREALARWALDTTLAMADVPDPEPNADPKTLSSDRLRFLMLKALATVLRDQKKNELLADRSHFTWRAEEPTDWGGPQGQFARYSSALKARQSHTEVTCVNGKRKETATPFRVEVKPDRCKIVLRASKGEGADVGIEIRSTGRWSISLLDEATFVTDYVKTGVPPRPDSASITRPIGHCINKNLKVLLTKEDWQAPFLQRKVKIPQPQADITPTHSATLLAIAKAAGVSLICEDFESHKWDQPISLPYDKEITLADALKSFEDRYTWLIDAQNRLVVGWSRLWPERHTNLMPQNLLNELANKLDITGVCIDDVTPLAHFTDDAMFEWLYQSSRLNILGGCGFGSRKPWQFYDKLGRQDKRLAWSDSGLSLASFDPAYVMEMFDLKDPAQVPYLVMKVKVGSSICLGYAVIRRIPTLKDGTTFRCPMLPPHVLKQEIYHIVLERSPHYTPTDEADKQFWFAADGPAQPLPLYSEQTLKDMVRRAGLKWEDVSSQF